MRYDKVHASSFGYNTLYVIEEALSQSSTGHSENGARDEELANLLLAGLQQ